MATIRKTTKGKGANYRSTEAGAGMTAKGRAAYNKATGSNLKPPAPNPKTKADAARKEIFLRSYEWYAWPDERRKG